MAKIRNFNCTYGNSVGISREITEPLGLEFPDAYKHRETMAQLSRAIKEHDGAGFCLLPFCRTVEIEAVGAPINYGDENAGPRAAEPLCSTPEEMLSLSDIDFSKGRIREVLEACRILADQGEHVCLEIVGPWTQMQSLMDPRTLFRCQRKQSEVVLQVMEKIGGQLLRYVDEARGCGVEIITYSDSAGTLNILGPRLLEQTSRDFTVGFLKRLLQHAGDGMVIQLCPKIAYALVDCGLATTKVHDLGERVDFMEAILRLKGEVGIVGQACIKNIGVTVGDGRIRELVLK